MGFGETDHRFELSCGSGDAFFGCFGVGAADAAELEVGLYEFFGGWTGYDGVNASAGVGDIGGKLVERLERKKEKKKSNNGVNKANSK